MAIDTAERRKAAGAIAGFVYGQAPGVTPNATPDFEWRNEVAWNYPGIVSAYAALPGAANESIRAFLNDQFGTANTDILPLVDRFLDADSIIDKTVSFRELKVDTDVENR